MGHYVTIEGMPHASVESGPRAGDHQLFDLATITTCAPKNRHSGGTRSKKRMKKWMIFASNVGRRTAQSR
jgi:hypothetical protein